MCRVAFKIPSGSMLPTLQIGDHILVNKFLYYFQSIERGDIIVFKFPQDETRAFIKRVIGMPGDTIEIRGKQIVVNGKPLDEPYAVYGDWPTGRLGERERVGPFVVPPDRLFMMGDNRDHSMDSRVWGFLDIHKVKGKAFIVYFSVRSEDSVHVGAPHHLLRRDQSEHDPLESHRVAGPLNVEMLPPGRHVTVYRGFTAARPDSTSVSVSAVS